MQSISVNQFRDQLKKYVDFAIDQHEPLQVTRRNGEDFIVISASDWKSEQETLYVLSNSPLMSQIQKSLQTFQSTQGKSLTPEQQDEIDRI
jgi:antitoxin YefM